MIEDDTKGSPPEGLLSVAHVFIPMEREEKDKTHNNAHEENDDNQIIMEILISTIERIEQQEAAETTKQAVKEDKATRQNIEKHLLIEQNTENKDELLEKTDGEYLQEQENGPDHDMSMFMADMCKGAGHKSLNQTKKRKKKRREMEYLIPLTEEEKEEDILKWETWHDDVLMQIKTATKEKKAKEKQVKKERRMLKKQEKKNRRNRNRRPNEATERDENETQSAENRNQQSEGREKSFMGRIRALFCCCRNSKANS